MPAATETVSRRTVVRGAGTVLATLAAAPVASALFPTAANALAAPGAGHDLVAPAAAQGLQRSTAGRPAAPTGRGRGPQSTSTATTGSAARDTKGLSDDAFLHLLRKATYGPTAASLAEIRQLGTAAWLAGQLAPQSIDDSETTTAVQALWPRLDLSSLQLRTAQQAFAWDTMLDLVSAHIMRATQSKRQLFEVMVDFWSNHLNVTCPSDTVWATRHLYDRDVVRANALGRFEDMLVASATHPAMLSFLDNASSVGTAPNENYGREVMELHTLGVAAGYTEADVAQAALAMTGLTITADDAELFTYDPTRRYVGPLSVFGWSSPNASAADGLAVAQSLLRYLANHPATALHVARKIATRFVSDSPSDALVHQLAAVYTAGGTAIAPVLLALFASREFAESSGQKVRTAFEDHVAAMRTVGYRTAVPATVKDGWLGHYWIMNSSGAPPLAWSEPNGYPDAAGYWVTTFTQLFRWSSHVSTVGVWSSSTAGIAVPTNDWAGLMPGVARPATMGGFVDLLAQRLLLQPAPPVVRAAVLASFEQQEGDAVADWRFTYSVDPAAVLLLSAPMTMLR